MKTATLLLGLALVALGVAGYVLTDAVSVTALIPAFFGVPLALLAFGVDGKPALAVAALVIAVVGLGGSAPGLAKLGSVFDGTAERPPAVIARSIMAVLSIVYVFVWIRARRASGGEAAS